MNENNELLENVAEMAAMAEALEKEAVEKGPGSQLHYTHLFKEPWEYEGKPYESLSFDWERLTGADSLSIENELRLQGITLVVPAFTGEYLVGMAARACVERKDESGKVVISTAALKSLPLADFQKITAEARNFLLKAGV